ncbi:hypothetical protein [Nocardia sp. CNY236]|uniref:TPR repeat region-containing protein n=1 Tax=Nocardia sp. CNY236 TaxID=1169152 RepID=UPI0018C95238|nr:hypothetical protein [Nocardia sp. CNY236]
MSDEWIVTADYRAAGRITEDVRAAVMVEASARQDAINSAYHSFSHAVTEAADAITEASGEIRGRGDLLGNGIDSARVEVDAGLTAEQGREDGETIADGKLSDEEIARIAANVAAAGLTETQLAAIERGEEVTIPASTMSYLTELYDKAGRDGLIGVSEQLRNDNTPTSTRLRESLANGLLTVSNEQVVGRDYRAGKDDRGGWNNLSPEVKELIGTRPDLGADSPDANTTRLPDDYRNNAWDSRNQAGSYKEYVRDMNRFGDFLNSSGDGYQPGDRLGLELSRQAAHQTALIDSGEYRSAVNPNERNIIDSRAEQAARDLLDVGTRNNTSNWALISGEGGDELFGKGEPGQKFNEDYDFDTTIAPMLEHEWNDDGQAAAGMFAWISDDATSPDAETAERAGHAAREVADYIAGNRDHLLNLDGEYTESLGQRNPALLQGMAESLTPYIPDMAAVPDDDTPLTQGFGDDFSKRDQDFTNAKNVFAVMDTDKDVAAYWNAQALTSASELQSAWLDSALNGEHGPRRSLAESVGVLEGLVDSGLTIEMDDRSADQMSDAKQSYADKSAAYDAIKGVLTTGIKYTPVIGPAVGDMASNLASPAIDITNTYVKNAVVGVYYAPDSADPNASGSPSVIDPRRWYQMAQNLEMLRGPIPHDGDFAGLFDSEGKLLSYDQLSDGAYSSGGRLTDSLVSVLEGYGGDELVDDIDKYRGAVSEGRTAAT